MKYLVTGGAGFIGSHLSQRLLATGHEVVALDNLSTGSERNLEELRDDPRFSFVHGSVTDRLLVDEVVADADVIVHLAAAVGVQLIIKHPLRSLITNIRGAENILEAASQRGVKTLVTSTSEIYGKNPAVPLSETSDRVLGPPSVTRWAYSTSKAVDEILAQAYAREKGLPTIVVRLFNTVGPRQSGLYGMVLPRFIEQALAGEDLTVFGDGTQTRCFCYVDDAVDAILRLLDDEDAEGKIFNVGNPEEVAIVDLAKMVIAQSGSTSGVRLIAYDDAYEEGFEDMFRRVPDIARVGELTGWTPAIPLSEIIERMLASYRAPTTDR